MELLARFTPFLIGLGTIMAIAGISWCISSAIVKKRAKRYAQAEAEAIKIRDLTVATYNCFKGKYMPPALRELLVEAWTEYTSLLQGSRDISSDEELVAVTNQVNEILERIKQQTLIEPTAADYEADKRALKQEENELNRKHNAALRKLGSKRTENRARIVQKRLQLDQEWAASLDCHPTVPNL